MACGGGGAEILPPGEANPPVNKDDQRYYGWRLVTDKSAAETFSKLSQMNNVPTWLFQGDQDEVAKGTIDMPSGAPEATAVELNKVGGNAQVKHFPGGHDAISRVPWDTPGFGQSIIDFFRASRRGGQCTPAARKLGRSAMWPGKDTLDAVSADDV